MKIHEYQGKDLLKAAGVAVQDGIVASTPEEAASAFEKLGASPCVVKAQVHAGGRGKGIAVGPDGDRDEALAIASGQKPRPEGAARGVQLVKTKDEARENLAEAIALILKDRREDASRGIPADTLRETIQLK